MKIVLSTLNAKYIHTNLAIRYLKQTLAPLGEQVEIQEYTINHHQDYIVSELYKTQPDLLCFSCYIWNIEMVLGIISTIKKIMPGTMIVLGGPEVSYGTKELMEHHDYIDAVIQGEGENTLYALVEKLSAFGDYSELPGIAYRARGKVFVPETPPLTVPLDQVPFPYEGEVLDSDKIVYYESSRGCPYNCQYCLSSANQGVRYLPLDRVKGELKYLMEAGVRQIKFVDRTFNARKDFALEIIRFIMEHHRGTTNFHFEVTADILDDEIMTVIQRAPVGLFQFEIGVQSTNEETLKAIDRRVNFEKLKEKVRTISSYKNIHQHLDLIVGLPKEDYYSFRGSFDDVFALRPEKLQVGFLKLLKGSGLREKAAEYGFVFEDRAPYEILETAVLSYGEVLRLKGIEEMVEIYWNSGMFRTSIEVLLNQFYVSPFRFFEDLWHYWEQKGYHHRAHNKNMLYETLMNFSIERNLKGIEVFKEVLKLDFLKNTRSPSLPSFFHREAMVDFKNKCHEFLQKEENILRFLPQYRGIPAKQIIKKVHFEQFSYDVLALEENPQTLLNQYPQQIVILFHYDLESKAIDQSKYYRIRF